MLHLLNNLDISFGFKFPSQLSGELVAISLLTFFGLLSTLEFLLPRTNLGANNIRKSYQTNISMFVLNSTLMSALSATSLFLLAQRYADQGLLRFLEGSPIWQAILSFVLLDLLLYLWHKACHDFDALWMFHRVHHNDPYLNTSTAFRIHFLELLLTNFLKCIHILLLGADQAMVMANEAIVTLFIMFHHSNISFKGEKWLGRLIIVPYLHLAHHSAERSEHDRNYGAVLSIWDWLFGTLTEAKPVTVGIKGYSPQNLLKLIQFGFTPIRPAVPVILEPVNLDAMIAEAAYYKAEKRNFNPGYELLDWIEAKREIIALVYGDHNPAQKKVVKTPTAPLKLVGLKTIWSH